MLRVSFEQMGKIKHINISWKELRQAAREGKKVRTRRKKECLVKSL